MTSAMEVMKDRRVDALGDFINLPDELICSILEFLDDPIDIGRLSCVSSVMYLLCNEEPLWMTFCLRNVTGPLDYKGSWKMTALHQHFPDKEVGFCKKPLHFNGFFSLFLYKRLYRCFTALGGFSLDNGDVQRESVISVEEFYHRYDCQKPVLLTGLAESWPARTTWTTDQLSSKYGDTKFAISQRSSKKITMKFKDYISYTEVQHDEDPLYIFDDKFGEVAPTLLDDYCVPQLFQEDYFDVLDREQRPPFRWLIIGPERSGASWHVDPALTSAWNTLLCGRKRWALYPPGRVPLGVTVHVNDENGDVNVDAPSSLQWWLDIYPLLSDQDKPIECTQLPGETIYVPSGWWHCVLNLETTIAVTQNFVNSGNFEFACLDMAPGHRHKGICRAGLLALDEMSFKLHKRNSSCDEDQQIDPDMDPKEKRHKVSELKEDDKVDNLVMNSTNATLEGYDNFRNFSYSIDFLSSFLEEERDHYNSVWSPNNCIGQRELRQWLHKLWVQKPGIRDLIWKGACLALNANKWTSLMEEICSFHNISPPGDDEKLPVGTGSNPVYLTASYVVKIFVEDGLESCIHGLGAELEFYSLLHQVNSTLKDHIPDVLASGILFQEDGCYKTVLWDGKGVPDIIAKCNLKTEKCTADDFPFGVWSKKRFECRKAAVPTSGSLNSDGCTKIWPYIITTRCKGDILTHIRDTLSWDDAFSLASFLGEQMRDLHLLPVPSLSNYPLQKDNSKTRTAKVGDVTSVIPAEWSLFIESLNRMKIDVSSRLTKWGDPIPSSLIEKVEEYIPDDLSMFLNFVKDENGNLKVCKSSCWIHSDIMDDNIYMESCTSFPGGNAPDITTLVTNGFSGNGRNGSSDRRSWRPSHILDFSNMSIGDPLCDLIPIHLDVFRGEKELLKRFLKSYRLPLLRNALKYEPVDCGDKYGRLSYHAMCYCILHDDNVLGAIFGLWKELRKASSWEEVEEAVWGDLNNYEGFP